MSTTPKRGAAATKPTKAIILARISDDKAEEEKGVTDQVADGRKLARRWAGRSAPTPPTSSWRTTPRRSSARGSGSLTAGWSCVPSGPVPPHARPARLGPADGLIAADLDRTARDPRDLEDLIDVVESKVPRIPVESVSGSLKLANDADITMARVMVAVANKSSRDTSRRVSRTRLRQAARAGSVAVPAATAMSLTAPSVPTRPRCW